MAVISPNDLERMKFKQVGTQSVVQTGAIPLSQRFEYDVNGNLIYMAKAQIGAIDTSPSWAIRRFTYDANNNLLTVGWASVNGAFTKKWADRAILQYL